jgi:Trypsin-co-occurring domain 1
MSSNGSYERAPDQDGADQDGADRDGATTARFEVAVAFAPDDLVARPTAPGAPPGSTGIPGVSNTGGRRGPRPSLVEKGEDILRQATEALARQIGTTARLIADAIEQQADAPSPGAYGLDSVQVAFGVTLSSGVQTVFTAQAESSVQVTITLSRQQPDKPAGA